jgi:hypothetical protein
MALKFKYAKREEIPAEQVALYVEREGAFYLDAEGATDKTKADELRNHNIELRKRICRVISSSAPGAQSRLSPTEELTRSAEKCVT